MASKIKKPIKSNEQIKIKPHENIKVLDTVKKEFILEGLGCANCAAKMESNIIKLQGVSGAEVNFVNKTLTMEIEELVKVDELVAAAKEIVTNIEGHVIVKDKEKNKSCKMVINLTGLCCANCAAKIEKEVNDIKGVKEAAVDFASQRLLLEREDSISIDSVINKVTEIVNKIEPEVKVQYVTGKRPSIDAEKDEEEDSNKKELIRFGVGAVIYGAAAVFKFNFTIELILYLISYILVGGEVALKAIRNIGRGQVFDENFLMFIATVGAFAIGEFPEAVAVMLFYQIGEMFQDMAVNRSRKSISALMDIRPDYANLIVGDTEQKVSPEEIEIGDFILVKPGEKVPLDGVVVEGSSMLDTSALTGESVPREAVVGDEVLNGVINKNGVLRIKVLKTFDESTVAKILDLVQNASSKKAPTESFITKFARYYTPVVVVSAAALAFVPPLFIEGAEFSQWIYRALVFLVVSCPCALVVSIPLGFFGGIGGASKNGILVKGGNYLEALNDVDTVVFDKTGTLTKGVFKVTKLKAIDGLSENELLEYAAHAEGYSNHPIAVSIAKAYGKDIKKDIIENYNEISGHGVKVTVKSKEILAGNAKLMESEGIDYDRSSKNGTVVHLALDRKYAGYIVISDEIKVDSSKAIKDLKDVGVRSTVMLTGDNRAAADKVGRELGIDEVYAELLPDQKVEKVEELNNKKSKKSKLIFVGDGINDAPVLARADIGIAMGGVGSDAAIEAADVVIMTDEPSKIVTAIKIAKKTKSIVIQNIVFALVVKVVILTLGALGVATMWEAVFGDVGVALIAVLNAMRAMKIEKG
jgi:Zn2+/Cd2+-exporting ATPase